MLLDPADRVLLLRASDPADPGFGEWLELPGGGVEPGETSAQAACREVCEETGYVVPPRLVGPVQWRGEVTYTWLGQRHWTRQEVMLARLTGPPEIAATSRTTAEEATFSAVLWLGLHELTGQRLFPDLPDLQRLLAGEQIDAGFLRWN